MAQIRDVEELEAAAATTTRRTIGAPRVQSVPEAGTGRKPSTAEIKARQDAIRETRRPTKRVETAPAMRAALSLREGQSAGRASVPDVEPSECGERDE